MENESAGLVALIAAQMDAAMTKLELRLVERFAAKKDHLDLEKRVDSLESVRSQLRGIMVALAFVVSTLATMSWHIWG